MRHLPASEGKRGIILKKRQNFRRQNNMLNIKKLKRGLANYLQDRKEPFKIPNREIEKFSLGESVEKRPIDCYQIGSGEISVMFASGMHGNEIGTMKLSYCLLDYLKLNEKKFKRLTFFVIPCLNVDGFEKVKGVSGYISGGKGRHDARKVDLNRNFPAPNFRSHSYVLPRKNSLGEFKYNKEISSIEFDALSGKNGKKESFLSLRYNGNFGGSEPETSALVDFVEKRGISIIFSFHNCGRDVMGGKDALSKELVGIYAEKTGYEVLNDDDWEKIGQTGTAKDWCDDWGISFVEVEGSTRYGSDWKIQKPAIEAVLKYLEEIA